MVRTTSKRIFYLGGSVIPYIEKTQRKALDEKLIEPANAGQLNYMFTVLAIGYLERKGESYQTYNDLVGALENCKLELYRRRIAKYEDEKIIQNTDVYPEKEYFS